MANWTVNQVGDWLKANGFEKYIKTFKNEDIDGAALMGLQDDDILKLLSILDEDGAIRNPTMRTQRKFRTTLEEYRTLVKQERKKKRRNSSSIAPSSTTVHKNNDIETYSKTYIVEPMNISLKFFKSELICSNLIKYFRKKYNVMCHIPMQDQYDTKVALHIKLSGVKENVKNARNDLQSLFETIKTKIFNNEDTDKRIIRWSKYIYSDSILTILQKIFSNKKKFTIWEKTNILSGYYIVHYINGQHRFSISEEFINHILNTEISYVKDIIISNIENIQIKFRKELDEFINHKKEQQQQFQTMAIIYSQYSSQKEMKINFFGLKNQVNIAEKQIKLLIDKHRMRTIRLELDPKQREYLLDNYVDKLKNIELDYKDDNVKIQIRENLITAPQYLIIKIKQLIQSMIFQITILIFQYIENVFILTEKDNLQLKILAQNYNCQINKIDIETKNELILLPKRKNISTSKYIIKQSNQFYSSLSIPRILSISNNTIEIHKSYDLTIDITIISTTADAIKEKIDPKSRNSYFESDTGRKVLFIQWSPPHLEKDNNQMKESIKKFISISLQQIDILCSDTVKTIAFSTTNWEKYDNRKQLAREILNEIKYQLETEQFSNRSWKILFIFDDKQTNVFNEFVQIILALQTEEGDYEQFFYPISTTSITLKTSGNSNISKCENAINNYIKKHILATIELNHPFDPEIWNQYMINAYYKYCLEKFVLLKIYRIDKQTIQQQRLDLIGPIFAVNEAKQKYELMSEIERQKILMDTQISKSNEQLLTFSTEVSNKSSDSYNIILSCCSDDDILSHRLAQRLIDEGYLVLIDYSDKISSNIGSKIDQTDLFIICFSFSYSQNFNCMTTMMSLKRSGKKIVPIVLIKILLNQKDNWFQTIATEELFYESFEQEIKFKLREDSDLDYDILLIELLHYTKPGAVGRTYPISDTILNKEEQREENLDQQNILSQFTPEQIREKEQIYEKYIEQILEKDKISQDELTDLIKSLKVVLEYCENKEYLMPAEEEQSIQDKNQDEVEKEKDQHNEEQETQCSETEEEKAMYVPNYLNDFLSSVQRWLKKATNGSVIKGNLPPFTLTGDFNDAVFPMPLTKKNPWWIASANLSDFDHSSPELHLHSSQPIIGSWCNYDEAHHYFQKFIDKDIQFREDRLKQRLNEAEKKQTKMYTTTTNANVTHHPRFKTNIRKGTVVWDITENREVLKEYERRRNGKTPTKSNEKKPIKPNDKKRIERDELSTSWDRLMDRYVDLISNIKEGNIDMKSDEVQGKIGKEHKTTKEIEERNQLDDPNNEIWANKQFPPWQQQFIQMKIRNTIEWRDFCATQINEQ